MNHVKAIENWNIINDQLCDVDNNDPDIKGDQRFLRYNKGFLNLHHKAGQYLNFLMKYEVGSVIFKRSALINADGIIDRFMVNELNVYYDYDSNYIYIVY